MDVVDVQTRPVYRSAVQWDGTREEVGQLIAWLKNIVPTEQHEDAFSRVEFVETYKNDEPEVILYITVLRGTMRPNDWAVHHGGSLFERIDDREFHAVYEILGKEES